jgi:hypothetical protein
MITRKYVVIALCSLLVLVSLDARRKEKNMAPACGKNEVACKDLKNPCKCYCGFKPGPRDKVADDKPIFIEDDPEKNYCYCKERDIKEVNRKRVLRGEAEIKY